METQVSFRRQAVKFRILNPAVFFCISFLISSVSWGFVPEELKRNVQDYLSSSQQQQRAARFLDCGKKLPTREHPADAIIYFAYATPTETSLNEATLLRLNEVLRVYKEALAPRIIVTGNGYPATGIAEKAKTYLLERGVAEKDVIMDSTSRTTYENLINAIGIADANHLRSFIFVSSPEHMDRIHRYYEKIVRTESFRNTLEIYWSSYAFANDETSGKDWENRIVHEVFTIIKDHKQYGNHLRSVACGEFPDQEFMDYLLSLPALVP